MRPFETNLESFFSFWGYCLQQRAPNCPLLSLCQYPYIPVRVLCCAVLSPQSCLTLWPHGLFCPWNSSVQITRVGIISFSRGSSQPRDRTQASHIAGDSLPSEPWELLGLKFTGHHLLSINSSLFYLLILEVTVKECLCQQIKHSSNLFFHPKATIVPLWTSSLFAIFAVLLLQSEQIFIYFY